MEIVFFHRNPDSGFSIYKVFNTIVKELTKEHCVNEYFVPCRRAGFKSIITNLLFVYSHRNKEAINHISGDIHYCVLALIGCKSVLTVHDLSAYECAKNPLKKIIIKWLWFKIPLFFVDKIVCISEHTKLKLLTICNRKDIEVIYNPIDTIFKPKRQIFNDDCPIILHIGTAWNKNLVNTIMALRNIKCHLIIVGDIDTSILSLLDNNSINYSLKKNLSDLELLEVYYNSDIVSFCSIYEGFGMPIIEANSIGRCVITSRLAPMTEIGSDAVYCVNPGDIKSIENGFNTIINDLELRKKLINNGFVNIDRFTPEKCIRNYERVYLDKI